MSKIEAGRMKLDMEPLDLSNILAESLRVVSGRAEDKHLTLDADIESTISVVADRRAVKQIIVNLLSNAGKIHPRRRPRHRAQPDAQRFDRARDRRHRHRHRPGFAAPAGQAVRTGREPAHQKLPGLGASGLRSRVR